MRLINKKTKANTTISNLHMGLHPFIRKVVCVFFIPLGNLVSRVSKIKNHTCITWQDKRENKIKPNQNYKDSQKNGKYVSSNDAFMFVLVFMSLRVSSCIRVFVYSCIRVSTNERECNNDQIFYLHEEHFILKIFRSSNTKDADVFFWWVPSHLELVFLSFFFHQGFAIK